MKNILMNKSEIKKIIPHREPMLFIDKVIEMVPGERIRTSYYLAEELDFFKGHFPGAPVMPGVLTVESMAQTSDVLILSEEKYKNKIPYFIGIDNVKFKNKIEPKDEIFIESKIYKENRAKGIVTCEVTVYNKGEICTTGLVTLAMR